MRRNDKIIHDAWYSLWPLRTGSRGRAKEDEEFRDYRYPFKITFVCSRLNVVKEPSWIMARLFNKIFYVKHGYSFALCNLGFEIFPVDTSRYYYLTVNSYFKLNNWFELGTCVDINIQDGWTNYYLLTDLGNENAMKSVFIFQTEWTWTIILWKMKIYGGG